MYTLSDKEKKFLRDFATSPDGMKMKKLLDNIIRAADSVSGINTSGDYGAQVEGRKIAKKLFEDITAEMVVKRRDFGSSQFQVDEFE